MHAFACKAILACKGYGEGGANLLGTPASRAHPNERLIRAFNIDNAFTTTDDKYRKDFRKVAQEKITCVDWWDILHEASTAASNYVNGRNKGAKTIDLGALIRSVSFQITMYVLFNIDPEKLGGADIEDITSSINDLVDGIQRIGRAERVE